MLDPSSELTLKTSACSEIKPCAIGAQLPTCARAHKRQLPSALVFLTASPEQAEHIPG